MKLTEFKNKYHHYFTDEQGRKQGKYKLWHDNGQLLEISHFRDDEYHGEYKGWDLSGKLQIHTFDINDEEIINFLMNPELYPSTPEEKTMFVLRYGNAPFISEGECK